MSRRVPVFGPKTETQRRATGQMAASPISAPKVSIMSTLLKKKII